MESFPTENSSFRGASISVRVDKSLDNGKADDPQVQPQRPIIDVPEVAGDPLLHFLHRIRLTTVAIYLSPARNPRFNLVTLHIGLDDILVILIMGQGMGPGSHDRHTPLEHVVKLWQFIQGGAPEEGSHASDAGVALPGLSHASALLVMQYHGAELVDLEAPPVGPGAVLLEEHGPGRGHLDGDGDHQADRQDQQADQSAKHEVLKPLD